MIEPRRPSLDSASLRTAGKELLSLALIDARNQTLALGRRARGRADGERAGAARRPRRRRRRRARPAALDARPHRLVPGVLDRAQRAARRAASAPIRRSRGWPRSCPTPTAGTTRRRVAATTPRAGRRRRCPTCRRRAQYLVDTLETTLDLLDGVARRGRRRALLPPPRAVPRGHARRGVRRAGADARHRRATCVPRAATAAPRAAAALPGDALAARRERRAASLRQRAWAACGRDARVRDRRAAGDLGAVRRVRRGRRLRRAGTGATPAGPGCSARGGARRATSTSCATACCSGASAS